VFVTIGVELGVSELLVGGDVQLEVKLEVTRQPLQQHDRQTLTTAASASEVTTLWRYTNLFIIIIIIIFLYPR